MDQETMDQLTIVMDKACDFYKEALKVPELASLITYTSNNSSNNSMSDMLSYCGLEDIAAQDRAFNEFTAKKITAVILSPLDRAC